MIEIILWTLIFLFPTALYFGLGFCLLVTIDPYKETNWIQKTIIFLFWPILILISAVLELIDLIKKLIRRT